MRLIAVILVPCLFLALLEFALHLIGFGCSTSFLLKSQNKGELTYIQNNKFTWRFFGKRMARTPNPFSIGRDKPPGTVRIFVLGESAAFGDPQPAFGLPRVLSAMLSLRHPGTNFEIINGAMTAINSHVILPIARDCARAHGDVWVIYMGNNEVVGPFGAGTIFGSQTLPLPWIRADLALKSTRFGQCLDALRDSVNKKSADKSEWGGMEMFLGQQVAADDPRMAFVYKNFARNLEDIIQAGHNSGAGVVVSTMAVNLRDCAPFGSRHRAGLSSADLRTLDDETRLGTQAQAAGDFLTAVQQFGSAAKLDDASAEIQFCLGRALLSAGDATGARKALIAARDLDTLRFRCDSRLNDLIRQAGSGREPQKILLADAETSFAEASPDALPGWNFFYEHVHFTFEGNYLLARAIAEKVEQLLPQNGPSPPAWPSIADCARRLGRTEHDLQPALADIFGRLADPPFATQINHAEQMQYWMQQLKNSEAHSSQKEALSVLQDAVKASPNDAQLFENLAVLEQSLGHSAEAETAARRAADLVPSSESAWSEMGYACAQEKKYDEALGAFQQAFKLNEQDPWPLQNIAMAQTKLGKTNDAMRTYRRAFTVAPKFGLAYLGLGQLLESEGKTNEASQYYQKALANRIHRPSELATLAKFCMARGWIEAAATNYDDAIAMDRVNGELRLEDGKAHFMLGQKFGNAGDAARAVKEFQTAAQLMPQVIEAQLNLGIALYQSGRLSDARELFDRIRKQDPKNTMAARYLDLIRRKTDPEAGK